MHGILQSINTRKISASDGAHPQVLKYYASGLWDGSFPRSTRLRALILKLLISVGSEQNVQSVPKRISSSESPNHPSPYSSPLYSIKNLWNKNQLSFPRSFEISFFFKITCIVFEVRGQLVTHFLISLFYGLLFIGTRKFLTLLSKLLSLEFPPSYLCLLFSQIVWYRHLMIGRPLPHFVLIMVFLKV